MFTLAWLRFWVTVLSAHPEEIPYNSGGNFGNLLKRTRTHNQHNSIILGKLFYIRIMPPMFATTLSILTVWLWWSIQYLVSKINKVDYRKVKIEAETQNMWKFVLKSYLKHEELREYVVRSKDAVDRRKDMKFKPKYVVSEQLLTSSRKLRQRLAKC